MNHDAFIDDVRGSLERGQAVWRRLPGGGRLYIDRPLPFLFVYRRPPGEGDAGTAALVTPQAAYLTAHDAADFQGEVVDLVDRLSALLEEACGGCLVVEVWAGGERGEDEEGVPLAQHPVFTIETPEDEAACGASEALAEALAAFRLEKRPAEVRREHVAEPGPPGLPPLRVRAPGVVVLGLEVLPLYRDAETREVYPLLLEETRRMLAPALKRAAFRFARTRTHLEAAHYLALGRRELDPATLEVDRRLAALSASFDFLLQVTPVNAAYARMAFEESGCEKEPVFRYRPLPVDPERVKRDLFELPIEEVEDPVLAALFREKQEEMDRQLTMLRDRDRRQFFYGSLQLYGEVDSRLQRLAEDLLAHLPGRDYDYDDQEYLDATGFAGAASVELEHYRRQLDAFPDTVQIRPDLPGGLMVSRGRLLIGESTRVPASRVEALLHHEVGTHMLTYYNGLEQPLRLLAAGLAGYEALQEGLAVLSEYLAGGLSVPRLRVLAARVLAAECLVEGASFVEVYRVLSRTHGFNDSVAFSIAMRTFRGGGLIKDVIYLRGLYELVRYLQEGGELAPLLIGKISLHHLPALRELEQRGVLRPASLRPRYMELDAFEERLARVGSGLTLINLVEHHAHEDRLFRQ